MGEFYDPKSMKRHSSPTTRLIKQKNSTSSHKNILSQNSNVKSHGLHYTPGPKKSYVIET